MKKKYIIIIIFISYALGVFSAFLLEYYNQKAKSEISLMMGLDLFNKKEYEKAIAILNRSIGIKNDWTEPHLALAQIYELQHKENMAIKEYETAFSFCKKGCLDFDKLKDKIDELKRKKGN